MNYAKSIKPYITLFMLFFTYSSTVLANTVISEKWQPQHLTNGIATGFPPYQFSENSQASGFDADVARLLIGRLSNSFEFKQDQWDNIVNELRFNQIDLIVGMEVNEIRSRIFDFSIPYYYRHDAIFVLEKNQNINQIYDLENQVIAGDRHSYIESLWKQQGTLYHYRIISTQSKEDSMQQLSSGKVMAAIMPNAVGLYLAKQLNIKVKTLENLDSGTPIAIAVKKGNQVLLNKINSTLERLIIEGEIDKLYQKWFSESLPVIHKDTVNT